MKPCGYYVVPSSGQPILVARQSDAIERAVQRNGTATPLFSIAQVCEFLEEGDCDEAIDLLREFEDRLS